jgi:hypothetical protein
MKELKIEERFQVISDLEGGRIVGSAYREVGQRHLTLYLRIFPGVPFFVTPHWTNVWEYLVFSGMDKSERGGVRFFCKVGSGVHLSGKNAIEIHLPDLSQVYYLNLEPEDFYAQKTEAA